jgi:hypothetical protein
VINQINEKAYQPYVAGQIDQQTAIDTAIVPIREFMMRQTYTNFFPNASFNYNPAPRKNLRFNYRGSTRAPSISQLQDVQDVSNRLNIRTGNPDLKQEFTHNFIINYSTFNLSNFSISSRCRERSQTVPIEAWACVLMLHPIGSPGDIVRMEFLGLSSTAGSPCATSGLAGGTAGPLVPVLVH